MSSVARQKVWGIKSNKLGITDYTIGSTANELNFATIEYSNDYNTITFLTRYEDAISVCQTLDLKEDCIFKDTISYNCW